MIKTNNTENDIVLLDRIEKDYWNLLNFLEDKLQTISTNSALRALRYKDIKKEMGRL